MSFCASFEKSAGTHNMSDIELTLKAEKHLHGAIKHDESPYKGAAAGGVAGGVGGLAERAAKNVKKGGHGRVAALAAGGAAVGGAAGLGIRTWHQHHLRRMTKELSRRGIFAVPRGEKIYWVKRRS